MLSPSESASEYSIPTWKQVPTTKDVIFSLVLPYQPPKSAVGAFLWRKRVWFECTFAWTMLQPWEKLLLVFFLNIMLVAFAAGVFLYLPSHLSFVHKRAAYYLLGQDVANVTTIAESIHRLAEWGWYGSSTSAHLADSVANMVEL